MGMSMVRNKLTFLLIIAAIFIFCSLPQSVWPAKQVGQDSRPKSFFFSPPDQDFQPIVKKRLARGRFRSIYRRTSPIDHTPTPSNGSLRIGTESRNCGSDESVPYFRESLEGYRQPSDRYPETSRRRLVNRRRSGLESY